MKTAHWMLVIVVAVAAGVLGVRWHRDRTPAPAGVFIADLALANEPAADAPAAPDQEADPSGANANPNKPADAGAAKSRSRPSDWPNLYGPAHDSVTTETNVRTEWPKGGPKELWRVETGRSYSAPAIVGDRLILFHRIGNDERVDCLDATTGERRWKFAYPTAYVDRYGYNNGPRCTPIVAAGRIYTFGAEGKLHCLTLDEGKEIWKRDLNGDYEVKQGFFGVGASPLLEKDRLIINVGGKKTGAGIVAIGIKTGKTFWKATDQGAGYSTPRAGTIHGERYVFVFTESGLVSIDPESGKVHWSIPFRSRSYESVNASPPVIVDDIVFVSATYRTGSLCLRIKPDGSYVELWRDVRSMDSHFSNFAVEEGYLYGIAGRHENGSSLRCIELATGKVQWASESVLGRGSMLRVGDRLILWGERGHLASIGVSPEKPTTHAFTDRPLLGYPAWTPPALSRGRLYLRNETNLLCLDLRSE